MPSKERSKEPEGSSRHAHTIPPESGGSENVFITCLVTPKITFSLQNRGYASAAEIPMADLRRAFLARFPIDFEMERIIFTPVLSKQLAESPLDAGLPSRIVFKIGVRSSVGDESLVDDEQVLLSILQSLDKAYAERHRAQLASAKTELLSSTMSFEVMADEIRRAQAGAAVEVGRLKDQASSSQKRLFMLELEKEQLQTARSNSDSQNGELRQRVDSLAAENRELRGQIGSLTEKLESLTLLVLASSVAAADAAAAAAAASGREERLQSAVPLGEGGTARAHTLNSSTTQTGGPSVDLVVSSMATWLRQGSDALALLSMLSANGSTPPPTSSPEGPAASVQLAANQKAVTERAATSHASTPAASPAPPRRGPSATAGAPRASKMI
mmetsp:Transcript_5034/g.12096  ORF Transcript_5034/g.12096 Transcript_5034/m.12096 type:complete len:386 (+) Transcript_5034:124-1281(+)